MSPRQLAVPAVVASQVERVLNQLWPEENATVAPINGGLTNWNMRVDVGGNSYALRIFGTGSSLIGIDRERELSATESAAAAGIGPAVVAILPEHSALVTGFIEGEVIEPELARSPEMLRRLGRALGRLHGCAPTSGSIDPVEAARRWIAEAARRGASGGERLAWAESMTQRIVALRGPWEPVLCHGDLREGNLLYDGGIRLVDWEYSGMGDPVYDLGNLSINFNLERSHEQVFLAAYGGSSPDERLSRLVRLYRFVSAFQEVCWAMLQTVISTLEEDFEAYASDYLGRLEVMGGETDFSAALAELEGES